MNSADQAKLDSAAAIGKQLTQSKKDNYFNRNSGFGGGNDPVNQAVFITPTVLNRTEVEDMYAGAWIVQRAINVLIEDATKAWVDFKTEDPDVVEYVNEKVKAIELRKHTFEALRLARLYGGSILVMGAIDGGNAEDELKEDSIKSIDFLYTVDRWQLNIKTRYDGPLKPKFGEPELYEINPIFGGSQQTMHESRVIRFDGSWLPTQKQVANQGWHDSVLSSMISDIKNFIISNQSAGQLLQDFITKVLKMPNLADLIENENFNAIEARIQYALRAMSNVGLSLIQGGGDGVGEDFDKIQTPITGFPDLLEKMRDMVCAAIGVPKVKLFGQQPGKLSGLDETIRIYDDEVAAYQETELRSPIERAYSLLLKSKENTKGEPDVWSLEFNPLRKKTDKEKADIYDITSQGDERYLNAGVLSADEVAKNRFTPDGFNQNTIIDIENREEMGDIDEEEKTDQAGHVHEVDGEFTGPPIRSNEGIDEHRHEFKGRFTSSDKSVSGHTHQVNGEATGPPVERGE